VTDFSPLSGMPLKVVRVRGIPGVRLAPLENCPLVELNCDIGGEEDIATLRRIKTLKKINGGPAAKVLGQ
jgi:hypothetical protein